MGLNDAAEMLEVAKAECGRLELDLQRIEGERDRARGTATLLEAELAVAEGKLSRLWERAQPDALWLDHVEILSIIDGAPVAPNERAVAGSSTAAPPAEERERMARELYRRLYPGDINTNDFYRTPESDAVERDRAYATWDAGREGWAPGLRCREAADALLAAGFGGVAAERARREQAEERADAAEWARDLAEQTEQRWKERHDAPQARIDAALALIHHDVFDETKLYADLAALRAALAGDQPADTGTGRTYPGDVSTEPGSAYMGDQPAVAPEPTNPNAVTRGTLDAIRHLADVVRSNGWPCEEQTLVDWIDGYANHLENEFGVRGEEQGR